jgi:hypothetical protein
MNRKLMLVLSVCAVIVLLAGNSISGTPSVINRAWSAISPRSVFAASNGLPKASGTVPSAVLRIRQGIHPYWLGGPCSVFVAPNGIGNDANTGASPSSPITLTTADAHTSPGSVVCLLGGRYEFADSWTVQSTGTSSAYVTFEAYGDGPVNIVWTNTSNSNAMIYIHGTYNGVTFSGPSYLAFQGLDLDGGVGNAAAGSGGTPTGGASSGFLCLQSVGVNFVGNTVTNTGGAGISAVNCDYVISDHNLIYHNGYNHAATGYGATSAITYNQIPWADTYSGIHNIISNNIVAGEVDQSSAHTDGNGIILDLPYGLNTNTPPALVLNNVGYGNGADCIETFGNFTTSQFLTNAWVVNNTCYANNLDQSGRGAITAQVTSNSFFVNNIVVLLSSGGVPVNGANAYDQQPNNTADSNVSYYNNLYFGTSSCCHQFSASSSWNNGINGDPGFVLPPYFYPSVASPYDSQYKNARPPLMGRPNNRSTTMCSSTPSTLWIPTCDIDSGFWLISSSSPAYNQSIDPSTLATDANIKASLRAIIYSDINGNPRPNPQQPCTSACWDLGAIQHF